jgi:hypothetical protein
MHSSDEYLRLVKRRNVHKKTPTTFFNTVDEETPRNEVQ